MKIIHISLIFSMFTSCFASASNMNELEISNFLYSNLKILNFPNSRELVNKYKIYYQNKKKIYHENNRKHLQKIEHGLIWDINRDYLNFPKTHFFSPIFFAHVINESNDEHGAMMKQSIMNLYSKAYVLCYESIADFNQYLSLNNIKNIMAAHARSINILHDVYYDSKSEKYYLQEFDVDDEESITSQHTLRYYREKYPGETDYLDIHLRDGVSPFLFSKWFDEVQEENSDFLQHISEIVLNSGCLWLQAAGQNTIFDYEGHAQPGLSKRKDFFSIEAQYSFLQDYPHILEKIVFVGSLDPKKNLVSSFSAGDFKDHFILAPVDLQSFQDNSGNYVIREYSSSSLATAYIAALTSSLKNTFPFLDAQAIKSCLLRGAHRDFESYDSQIHGWGIANYEGAHQYALQHTWSSCNN